MSEAYLIPVYKEQKVQEINKRLHCDLVTMEAYHPDIGTIWFYHKQIVDTADWVYDQRKVKVRKAGILPALTAAEAQRLSIKMFDEMMLWKEETTTHENEPK